MGGFWLLTPPVPLIEPVPAPEIYISGPGGVWYENGMLMMPCYRTETLLDAPGEPAQRVVKLKLSWPHSKLEETIEMLKWCRNPAPREVGAAPNPRPHLVR